MPALRCNSPDQDTSFVYAHELKADLDQEECIVCIVLSTPQLLHLASKTKLLQLDSMYKLNLWGYPVFLLGVTDANCTLHPFVLSICNREGTEDFAFSLKALWNSIGSITGSEYKPTVIWLIVHLQYLKLLQLHFGNDVGLICYFHEKKVLRQDWSNFLLTSMLL